MQYYASSIYEDDILSTAFVEYLTAVGTAPHHARASQRLVQNAAACRLQAGATATRTEILQRISLLRHFYQTHEFGVLIYHSNTKTSSKLRQAPLHNFSPPAVARVAFL